MRLSTLLEHFMIMFWTLIWLGDYESPNNKMDYESPNNKMDYESLNNKMDYEFLNNKMDYEFLNNKMCCVVSPRPRTGIEYIQYLHYFFIACREDIFLDLLFLLFLKPQNVSEVHRLILCLYFCLYHL